MHGTVRRYRHPVFDHEQASDRCALRFSLSAKHLEQTVRGSVTEALSKPDVLRRGVEAYEASRGATDIELQSSVAHIQKQITKVRQDEARLISLMVADGEQKDLVEAKLRELAQRRGALAADLRVAEVKAARHASRPDAATIERICAQARRGLAALGEKGWAALVRETIDEVRVTPTRMLEIRGILSDVSGPAGPAAAGTSRPCSSSPSRLPCEMGRAC